MRWFIALVVSLSIAACGGGGGGGAGGSAPTVNASSSVISGVAAVGNAISGRITLLDASGQDRYVDTTDGNFSFRLQGLSAPVLLRAQWADANGLHTLYSFASAEGVANITPLTHLAVGAAAGATSLDALFNAPSASAFQAIRVALPGTISTLQAALQPVLSRYAVNADNPITFRFVPNHTGMDAVLDNITVAYSGSNVTVTDKVTGITLLAAPLTQLAQSVSTASWGSADAMAATDTDVAINSTGTGLVAWTEKVAGRMALRARLMDGNDSGVTLSAGNASAPRVAWDGAGNAVAVWVQGSSTFDAIWASRFSSSSRQWSAARQISATSAPASAIQPDVALDAAGQALVVWTQGNGQVNHFDAWSTQYTVATDAWSAPSLVSDGSNSAYGASVARHSSGLGLVAWKQERGAGSASSTQPVDIWARSVASNGALGNASRINVNSAGLSNAAYAMGPLAVAMNNQGGAAVVWSQRAMPSLPLVVQAAMHSAATGWQAAAAISPSGTDDCYAPQVGFDAAGNAMAVWQQQNDFGAFGGSNQYTVGSGWGSASIFADARNGDVMVPSLAVDGAGNATVVWYRWSSFNAVDLMMRRYLSASGWNAEQVFAPMGADTSAMQTQPRVVANASGQTVVVWGANQSAAGL